MDEGRGGRCGNTSDTPNERRVSPFATDFGWKTHCIAHFRLQIVFRGGGSEVTSRDHANRLAVLACYGIRRACHSAFQ